MHNRSFVITVCTCLSDFCAVLPLKACWFPSFENSPKDCEEELVAERTADIKKLLPLCSLIIRDCK